SSRSVVSITSVRSTSCPGRVSRKAGVPATKSVSKSERSNSCTLFAPCTRKHCSCLRYFFICRDLTNLIRAFESIFTRLAGSNAKYIFLILLTSSLLAGCAGLKHLGPGEKMLAKQEIKAPKVINKEDLRN